MTPTNRDTSSQTAHPEQQGEVLSIPVVSEEAEIHKVSEHTGTVRVRKITRHVTEEAPAQGYCEHVETERVALNRPVDATETPRYEDGVLVIPLYEERLIRQLILREEIRVTRRREPVDAAGQTLQLRREEVIVERLDPVTRQWIAEAG